MVIRKIKKQYFKVMAIFSIKNMDINSYTGIGMLTERGGEII